MKRYLFAALSLLVSFVSLQAQNEGSVTGKVIDKKSKETVVMASVSLLRAKDSTYVKEVMTDSLGIFRFSNVGGGQYLILLSYLGYKNTYVPVTKIDGTPFNAGTIQLSGNSVLLKEAVVVGNAPEVRAKRDTIEYNAGSYKVAQNSVVEDLIKKLPGAEVASDGTITVNGKQITKFLVDGKEFFSDNPTVASKNLPADMVDKLQVFDKQSDMAQLTGFDPGDDQTVINITVKKGMKKGTIGNAIAGIGKDLGSTDKDTRYQATGFLNKMLDDDRYTLMVNTNNMNNMGFSDMGNIRFGGMRGMRRGTGGITENGNLSTNLNKAISKKLSLNGDFSAETTTQNSGTDALSSFLQKDFTQVDRTNTLGRDISRSVNTRFLITWNPTSKDNFIIRPTFTYNKSISDQTQQFDRIQNTANKTDSLFSGNSNSRNEGEGYYAGNTIEYSHKFDSAGRTLSASLETDYNYNYSHGISYWQEYVYSTKNDSIRNQVLENDNKAVTLKGFLSYVEPLGHNNFGQITYSLAQYNTTSDYTTYTTDPSFDFASVTPDQSRSTTRTSTQQHVGLNFKAVRKKYNYTIGVNFDPTSSDTKTWQPSNSSLKTIDINQNTQNRLPDMKGDSLISDIKQTVVNVSPMFNLRYNFDERTNLRIDYSGTTNQPSADQLRDYIDKSNPLNLVQGNPNLKPGYSNSLQARFGSFNPTSQIFYNFILNGTLSFNDITSVTSILDQTTRLTTYKNVNGNWNLGLRGMFNIPLKNKKFTFGNFMNTTYSNTKGYINEAENLAKNYALMDRLRFNYRCDLFDFGVNGLMNYNNVKYNLSPTYDKNTYTWGFGGNTTWYIPYNWTLDSDITFSKSAGLQAGYNLAQTLWNASISKQILNKKGGTGSLMLKVYDILQQRKSINFATQTNGYSYTKTTTIPSFFTFSFIYKFSAFPKGSSASEKDMMTRPGRGGFPGGGRPGGDGRPF